MLKNKTQKIAVAGLFAALVFIVAKFVSVPAPVGVIQLGDAIVITAGLVLGPIVGGLASGIGASLFDLSSGYAVYAPATLVIKFAQAAAAYYIFKMATSNSQSNSAKALGYFLAGIGAGITMIAGYFAYELVLSGMGNAIATISFNSVQAIGSVIAGYPVFIAVSKAFERMKLSSAGRN